MKKIKDWSKTIGVVSRAGVFSPSNEASEKKWSAVFSEYKINSQPLLTIDGFRWFRDSAKSLGYKIIVIEKGLNR